MLQFLCLPTLAPSAASVLFQFMYETPFTREGGAHGTVERQWRRRTVLTTDYCFPYVRTRIPVIRRQVRAGTSELSVYL